MTYQTIRLSLRIRHVDHLISVREPEKAERDQHHDDDERTYNRVDESDRTEIGVNGNHVAP